MSWWRRNEARPEGILVDQADYEAWLKGKLGEYYLRFTLPRNGFRRVVDVNDLKELDTLREVLNGFGLDVLSAEEMGDLWRPYIVAIRTRPVYSAVDQKQVGSRWFKDGFKEKEINYKSCIGDHYRYDKSALDYNLHVGIFEGLVIDGKIELAFDTEWPAAVREKLGWGKDRIYMILGYKQPNTKSR